MGKVLITSAALAVIALTSGISAHADDSISYKNLKDAYIVNGAADRPEENNEYNKTLMSEYDLTEQSYSRILKVVVDGVNNRELIDFASSIDPSESWASSDVSKDALQNRWNVFIRNTEENMIWYCFHSEDTDNNKYKLDEELFGYVSEDPMNDERSLWNVYYKPLIDHVDELDDRSDIYDAELYIPENEEASILIGRSPVLKAGPIMGITISNLDIDTHQAIFGVKNTLTDEVTGNSTTWESGQGAMAVTIVPGHQYRLIQEDVPEDYQKNNDVTFSVTEEGKIVSDNNFENNGILIIYNKKKDTYSTSVIIKGNEKLDGTELKIKALDDIQINDVLLNDVKTEIVDNTFTVILNDKDFTVFDLPAGNYEISAEQVADGYLAGDPVKFTVTEGVQQIDIPVVPIKTLVSVRDKDTKTELNGTEMQITDLEGNEIVKWTSEGKTHMVEGIPAGRYMLNIMKPADGYVTPDPIEFEVFEKDDIQIAEIECDHTKVYICAIDNVDWYPVEGIKLNLTNKAGEVVAAWVADDWYKTLDRVPIGEYELTTLDEVEGYEYAESVPVSVQDTGKIQDFYYEFTPIGAENNDESMPEEYEEELFPNIEESEPMITDPDLSSSDTTSQRYEVSPRTNTNPKTGVSDIGYMIGLLAVLPFVIGKKKRK